MVHKTTEAITKNQHIIVVLRHCRKKEGGEKYIVKLLNQRTEHKIYKISSFVECRKICYENLEGVRAF